MTALRGTSEAFDRFVQCQAQLMACGRCCRRIRRVNGPQADTSTAAAAAAQLALLPAIYVSQETSRGGLRSWQLLQAPLGKFNTTFDFRCALSACHRLYWLNSRGEVRQRTHRSKVARLRSIAASPWVPHCARRHPRSIGAEVPKHRSPARLPCRVSKTLP